MIAPTGVVVMAYGTPKGPEDIEAYYTHIRRGRPPTPELLEDLQSRYETIGGTFPLRALTEAQTAALAQALGPDFVVALGQKHASPFIEDGLAAVAGAGVEYVVGVVLAPHYSRGSVGEYAARLQEAAEARGLRAVTVTHWHDLPEWRAFQAAAIADSLAGMPEHTKVLFTAHSLPERVLVDDPYPDQLHESAASIATLAGLDRWSGWGLAWQSAGRTPDPWRGPDILAVLDDLAGTGKCEGAVVCPQGFTADHLEVVFDLDNAAARRARHLGLALTRTRSLNADPVVMAALARRVAQTAEDSWGRG